MTLTTKLHPKTTYCTVMAEEDNLLGMENDRVNPALSYFCTHFLVNIMIINMIGFLVSTSFVIEYCSTVNLQFYQGTVHCNFYLYR